MTTLNEVETDIMTSLKWQHYPLVAQQPDAKAWLTLQQRLGMSGNTLDAYGRGLEDYFKVCEKHQISILNAQRDDIAVYVNDMSSRDRPNGGQGLANATMQQRLTAIRLFYDYLVEEGQREKNPVKRGVYVSGRTYAGPPEKGLVPRFQKLPWIPNSEEWLRILEVARLERLRNRLMFAMAYDSALRREELCSLETSDIDPAHRLLRIRAETTKTRRDRIVSYSVVTAELLQQYLRARKQITHERGALFRTESPRNRGAGVSIWTWSKVIRGIALRSGIPQFSTHSLRHLCLTDLARANWDLHEIAQFAGHQSTQTTLQYIHLSGRELGKKYTQTISQIHAKRLLGLQEHTQ